MCANSFHPLWPHEVIYASFPFCIWGKLEQKTLSETPQRSYGIGSWADWGCLVLVARKETGYGGNRGAQGLAASLLETWSEGSNHTEHHYYLQRPDHNSSYRSVVRMFLAVECGQKCHPRLLVCRVGIQDFTTGSISGLASKRQR